jgi:hypothetical protein
MTTFHIDKDSIEILDGDLIKTAAIKLPDGIEYDPDFFYMKVRAVSAGEYWGPNKNADFFPEEELKKNFKTFLNAHTFKNHENKDIANAIGDVLSAEWNDKMKGVDLLLRIDRRIAPTIVRGFEKGFMTDVSMGCRIEYSICSICGNKAKTKFEYCDHIKYMRHKIFPDGKRVCEINIGPKFHDISAVLNGAERAAKVTGMMIIGNKVAFVPEVTLEKVASIQDAVEGDVELVEQFKVASIDVSEADAMEILGSYKPMDKKSYIQKVAEIKKEIQGKIVNLVQGEYINDRMEKAEELSGMIKLLYENFWDGQKCEDIADRIRSLAIKNDVPIESAFDQFLQVLDFAGIELSPLEFHEIFNSLINNTISTPQNDGDDMDSLMADVDDVVEQHSMAKTMNMPSLFSTIRDNIMPNSGILSNKLTESNPIGQMKAIIIKVHKNSPDSDDSLHHDLMEHVVSPLMPDRSIHRKFLLKRMNDVAEGKRHANNANTAHFAPIKSLKSKKMVKHAGYIPEVLSSLMYATYQDNRVKHLLSDDFEYGLNKFASYIEGNSMDNLLNEFTMEKKAFKGYTRGRAMLAGLPLTYGYSALQRSRINNGENVNSANRFIAENPGSAYVAQAVVAPMVNKAVKKGAGKAGKFLKSLAKAPKVASDELIDYVLSKTASEEEYSLYTGDMFKNAEIDTELSKKYDENQIAALKYACVLTVMNRQDVSDNMLHINKLAESDVSEYLQICKNCIRMDIEKQAGVVRNALMNAAGDIVFNPLGSSALATLPGNLLDGAVFAKVSDKLSKAGEPNKEVKPAKQTIK